MFVRKTECVLACKVRVCKFDAKTTHPELGFFFCGITHIEIHRMSASGLVIVSDRVRRKTMMIPHHPKMDRCCPPHPPNPSPTPPSHARPRSLALSR